MYLVCFILCLSFQVSSLANSAAFTPNFQPYCIPRDECEQLCDCKPAPGCILLTVEETLKNQLLFWLNNARYLQTRGYLQASGLAELLYDKELEEISECTAVKCLPIASRCFRTSNFTHTSQITHRISTEVAGRLGSSIWLETVNMWLHEMKVLTVDSIENSPDYQPREGVHNFAQLMSDRVLYVGCAWSLSVDSLIFICTFGPRGPMKNESIYRIGEPCTTCPIGYLCDSVQFPQLCTRGLVVNYTDLRPPPDLPPLLMKDDVPAMPDGGQGSFDTTTLNILDANKLPPDSNRDPQYDILDSTPDLRYDVPIPQRPPQSAETMAWRDTHIPFAISTKNDIEDQRIFKLYSAFKSRIESGATSTKREIYTPPPQTATVEQEYAPQKPSGKGEFQIPNPEQPKTMLKSNPPGLSQPNQPNLPTKSVPKVPAAAHERKEIPAQVGKGIPAHGDNDISPHLRPKPDENRKGTRSGAESEGIHKPSPNPTVILILLIVGVTLITVIGLALIIFMCYFSLARKLF